MPRVAGTLIELSSVLAVGSASINHDLPLPSLRQSTYINYYPANSIRWGIDTPLHTIHYLIAEIIVGSASINHCVPLPPSQSSTGNCTSTAYVILYESIWYSIPVNEVINLLV